MSSQQSEIRTWAVAQGTGNEVKSAIPVPTPTPLSQEASRVYRLIAKKDFKSAIYEAKALYKRQPNTETEALLIVAYSARIRDLLDKGLIAEGKSLTDMVRNQFPSSGHRMEELTRLITVRGGTLEDMVRPLNDRHLSEDDRRPIEETIKREVTDLKQLAECGALADDHPLRRGARVVLEAFRRVTESPVPEDSLGLEQISHRSPLAPWKLLVRALAAFYRREDDRCEKMLDMIEPDCVPARLVPVVREMIRGKKEPLTPAGAGLVRQVRTTSDSLTETLARLDHQMAKKDKSKILSTVEQAIRECREFFPDRLEKFKQHFSVRCTMIEIPAERVLKALGGPSLHDAYFFRLQARATEATHQTLVANSLWEEFRRNALHEGWFAPFGVEEGSLYLHMAQNLRKIPPHALAEDQRSFMRSFKGYHAYYENQPESAQRAAPPKKTDFYFLFPYQLYERACQGHKDPEVYRQWLDHTEKPKEREKVALAWHKAFPVNARPLLHLMSLAEGRNALQKALGYLEKAEQINPLDTEVRRARLRLLISNALRHLRQKKTHLVVKGIEDIAGLTQSREGNRPAFFTALRVLCAMLDNRPEEIQRWSNDIRDQMGSEVAVAVVLSSLAGICGLKKMEDFLPDPGNISDMELVKGVAGACALGSDLNVPFPIPRKYAIPLWDALTRNENDVLVDSSSLRVLAKSALKSNLLELAYVISGAGLRRGGTNTAMFLYFRGKSFPEWVQDRQDKCFLTAMQLARQNRDQTLVDEILEALHATGFTSMMDVKLEKAFREDPRKIEAVLAMEKDLREYPQKYEENFDEDDGFDQEEAWDDLFDDPCDCPECRRRREKLGRFELPADLIPPEFQEIHPDLLKAMLEFGLKFKKRKPSLNELEDFFIDRPGLAEILEKHFESLKNILPPVFPDGPKSRKKKRKWWF